MIEMNCIRILIIFIENLSTKELDHSFCMISCYFWFDDSFRFILDAIAANNKEDFT